MGMSLGAYICFGFPLKYPEDFEEELDWDIHEDSWEKVYAERKFGITEPTEEFDKNNPEILKKYHDYWDKTSELKKSTGVEVKFFGVQDFLGHFFAIKRLTIATDYEPKRVTEALSEIDNITVADFAILEDIIEVLNIPAENIAGEIGWYLFGNYW